MDRVLAVARYSGEDDAGAIDRQKALLGAWVAEDDGRVMANGPDGGWVVDETVSGSINLDERRSLGQWLRDPLLAEWDVLAVTMQDRVTRDDIHWWAFVGRLLEWGKRLVVLDDPALDLSTPNGRMIAGIKATQAANYREDVKKKLKAAKGVYRTAQRRWVGGHWPFGYRAIPRDGEEGWCLIRDPKSSAWVREAVDRVLQDDHSLREILRDWESRGIPTAREFQAAETPVKAGQKPRPVRSYTWNISSLRRILLNPSLLGYAVYRGELIREDGLPVQLAEPIITVDEALELRERLEKRAGNRRGVRSNRSPLLGVAYCACGQPMHFMRNHRPGRVYRYYRCSTDVKDWGSCPVKGGYWPENFVQTALEESFLSELGDVEIQRTTFIPGVNRSQEIASLTEAIEHLTGNLGNLPAGSRAASQAIEKLAEYEATLDALEAEPVTPAKEIRQGTGETFGQWWQRTEEWQDRGAFLMRSGIWLELGGSRSAPVIHLRYPADLVSRASRATG